MAPVHGNLFAEVRAKVQQAKVRGGVTSEQGYHFITAEDYAKLKRISNG